MQETQLRAWIALHRTPGLSARSLSKLLSLCDSPQQIWELSAQQLEALDLPPAACKAVLAGPDRSQHRKIDNDLNCIAQQAITLLPLSSPHYPALLKETAYPPPLLYVKGCIAALQRPQIAMVGSRHCSRQGAENAFSFGGQFAQAGLTVTSGCALGIDTQSHYGALSVEGGCSVGVLGTGVDVIYPKRNRPLFEQLLDGGALLSEFPLGTQPHRALFPQRNRLISGLSLGVLVIEAALKSGSLITARYALDQNREVFALPGSIHNPASEGCNHLIQQGARLITSAVDIMEDLSGWLPSPLSSVNTGPNTVVSDNLPLDLAAPERTLVDAIGYDPASIDMLLERTGWAISELQAMLTTLELKGLIEYSAGCYQRMAANPTGH